MSGVILLSGCDNIPEDELLSKKDVFELKQYCIKSGADSYRLDSPKWHPFNSAKARAKITRVICQYADEENDLTYEIDALTLKERENNGNR